MKRTIRLILFLLFALAVTNARAQDRWKELEKRPSTLGLEKGYVSFNVPGFRLKLVKASQTVAALSPAVDTAFDFTPGERLKLRSSDGMYHLGDLDLRLRFAGETEWKKYATATKRADITTLPVTDSNTLAAADLANTLPADIPLHVERYWKQEGGHLVLLFRLRNTSAQAVEIGSLGMPVIFNNILQGKSLEQAHAENVFYDPYIGMDAGYLQVTRLNGHGPALLVVPYGHTPFEAYNPLRDATPLGMDFEGFYEWMPHSKAYAENEWKKADPWNPPTSATLQPGETREYGLEFLLAGSIKGIEQTLKARADHWHSLQYPFGSEMPWDSTGQEEVYAWSVYFGYDDKAETTINAILGYMPTVPHWGYNGSARRYWDFLYGGKLSRIERQLHHYGSGLNAIPVLSEYRRNPADLYLLRVGYGGLMGSISNITEDGFGPAAFHSYPSTLKIDGLSGDYGPNFFGYAVNDATYITYDKSLGWLAFGGNLSQKGASISVDITSGARSRVFIAPLKLWLTLNAGTFKTVSFNPQTGHVTLTLNAADKYTLKAYLHILQDGTGKLKAANYKLIGKSQVLAGAHEIALRNEPVQVGLIRD